MNLIKKVIFFCLFLSLSLGFGINENPDIIRAAENVSLAQSSDQAFLLNANRFKYLGWWGKINNNSAGVYAEPAKSAKKLGTFSKINRVKVLEELAGETIGQANMWYKIDGGAFPGAYVFSGDVTPIEQPEPPKEIKIPKGVNPGEYWMDTDLAKKVLTLFLYDKPVLATYVSPGRIGNATITGTFRVYYKLSKARMRGTLPYAPYRYDLKNVPYVMYYRGSYGIHGTYWHDKFGARQSSGCTNLTQGDAKFIFELISPILSGNSLSVVSTGKNPGTVVYNHY